MAAPGGTGPIGPFPPGVETDEQKVEYDKLRRRVLWSFPSGLYILGSRAGERRNGMTLNWSALRYRRREGMKNPCRDLLRGSPTSRGEATSHACEELVSEPGGGQA